MAHAPETHAPETHRWEVVLGPESAGRRLDVVMGEFEEVGSRARASLLIQQGAMLVAGALRPKRWRVAAGQRVSVDVAALVPPAVDLRAAPHIVVPILFEDAYLMVVDKPAGLVVHPAPGHAEGTLVNALLGHGPEGGEAFRPGIVHRLDRDTSGLMLVAKEAGVQRRLSRMIREREVERRYLALVRGDIPNESGTIEAPVGRDERRRTAMAVEGRGARSAVTHFAVRERFAAFTLLEARLETGRTHQIRVHFQAIGHPVAGDPTYSPGAVLGLTRQFLHSHRLRLRHPVDGSPLDFSSPLPSDLAEVLRALRPSTGKPLPGAE